MQEIRHDGSRGDIKPFMVDGMENSLEKPEVKEVRVFKIRPNMKVNLNGNYYRVTFVTSLGDVTLQPIPKPKRPSHSVRGSIEEEE